MAQMAIRTRLDNPTDDRQGIGRWEGWTRHSALGVGYGWMGIRGCCRMGTDGHYRPIVRSGRLAPWDTIGRVTRPKVRSVGRSPWNE